MITSDYHSGLTVAHLCCNVHDLASGYAQLLVAGVHTLSEPHTATAGRNASAQIVSIRDPDGFWIELLEDRPDAGDTKESTSCPKQIRFPLAQ